VIDDDENIRKGTTTLLNNWECQVTASESPQAALTDLATIQRPPDLLICDYRLREGVTGVDAIECIREHVDPELPALLVTGDTDPGLRSELSKQGYYVLSKPIKPAHLKNVMSELLT